MEVKRIGGAFGCKISRASIVACAASLAAYIINKPVRMVLSMETNMKTVGKRPSTMASYEAGVNSKGVVQYLDIKMYDDVGVALNDAVWLFIRDGILNAYDDRKYKMDFFAVKTDNAGSVWTRAPGTLESMAVIEHIMDHIAQVTKVPAIDVRLSNLNPAYKSALNEMVTTLKGSAGFDDRLAVVEKFNEENRWKKRGLSMVVMRYEIIFIPPYYATVSIFPGDGSVVVTTGGIEMGQGLNTKAAQVCAYALGLSVDQVRVMASVSFAAPGNSPSGGSITSDSVCSAVLTCCEELNSRLGPLKEKMKNPPWPALIQAAAQSGLKLIATHSTNPADPVPKNYPVFGVTTTEVEVDVLTGQYQILRVDILEDAGESLNPAVDVGQIEGAFVMGLGYFGSEELKYNPDTGLNLTHRTWDYWPPGAKDIPIDFRITFRKNSVNPVGVLRSKTTGEPPICMSVSLPLALRHALWSARMDAGLKDEWFQYDPPCTFEKTYLAAGTEPLKFTL